MKKTVFLLMISCILGLLSSCDHSIDDSSNDKGYLRINVGTVVSLKTQKTRVDENYDPKQIAVKIINAAGQTVKETADWTNWKGTSIELEPGIYTVSASSNGFDGAESGFDIPYYCGSVQVTVQKNKNVPADIICTLANVKVTVNFDQTFIETFRSATSTVSSEIPNVNPLNFVMGTATSSAYFPVGNLSAKITVVNKDGKSFDETKQITDVKARDHFILNYKVAQSGSGNVTVVVDESEKTYTYTFEVSTEPTTVLKVSATPNAWSRFAMLTGEIATSATTLDDTKMVFEYQPKGETEDSWSAIAATKEEGIFKANVKDLEPSTEYLYRMKYIDGADEFVSDAVLFETEGTPSLPNGNMDDWYSSKIWYPASEAYYNANGGSFWGTSNIFYIVAINVTTGNSSVVHTAGGQSAELKSAYKVVKFAAASLYAGKFVELVGTKGAKLSFGQPFAARPTQLHGWFQYSTGAIDYVGDNTPSDLGIVKNETLDNCAIYVAMTTKAYEVNNTLPETFIDFDNDPAIIAYGEVPVSECVSTNGAWKEINIDLKYRNLTTKPTHVIIVCSASKYGDYFTGSTSSTLYIDDLELIYGDHVVTN